ncbi:LuxR C-terminal-related transcriptional regulator, partial [Escherichia coli]|uniref:LuxR C-terminal-related transcriptional regulator n=1 Tax=Escherichia coli TaxID=562 RepID=UPI001F35CEAB
LRFSGPKTSIICSPMTSLKTSIKTITYLSDIGCLEIQGASLAGARGFLSKRCSPDELIAAVHTVATGGCYLTPDIAIKLASGRQDPLTKRERQVAEKLAQGMAVKEIAAELGLSPKTVHVHRANLMEKLGVSNDVELARRMFDGW